MAARNRLQPYEQFRLEAWLKGTTRDQKDSVLAQMATAALGFQVTIANVGGTRRLLGYKKHFRHLLRKQDLARLEDLLRKCGRAVVCCEKGKRPYITTLEVSLARARAFVPGQGLKEGYMNGVDSSGVSAQRRGPAPAPAPPAGILDRTAHR
mgnify:CR=1 FL=1